MHTFTDTALRCQHAPQSYLLPTPAHMHRTIFPLQQRTSVAIYCLYLHICTSTVTTYMHQNSCTYSQIQLFIANMRPKAVYSPRLHTCTEPIFRCSNAAAYLFTGCVCTHELERSPPTCTQTAPHAPHLHTCTAPTRYFTKQSVTYTDATRRSKIHPVRLIDM